MPLAMTPGFRGAEARTPLRVARVVSGFRAVNFPVCSHLGTRGPANRGWLEWIDLLVSPF